VKIINAVCLKRRFVENFGNFSLGKKNLSPSCEDLQVTGGYFEREEMLKVASD
jgi:hypothetical protein